MRCIETSGVVEIDDAANFDKLQHEMYWNNRNIIKKENPDKLQHEMYWNGTEE